MKKSVLSAILIFALIFAPDIAYAASSCSYSEKSELNAIAANVKATYEIIDIKDGTAVQLDSGLEEDPIVDVYVKGFEINILNVTNDVYVTLSNDNDENIMTYRSENLIDNIASYQTKNRSKLITYTINVYSNKYSCIGELLRTFTIRTPIYNNFSEYTVCSENPEFYYCQEFISSEPLEFQEFYDQLEKYKETKKEEQQEQEKNKNFFEKIKTFFKEHKIPIITITATTIVIIGGTTIVILVKKRRSRAI